MPNYIISFNQGDMEFPEEDLPQVAHDAHEVLRAAKAAGAWIFGGGFDGFNPTVVTEEGVVTQGPLAQSDVVLGGFSILKLSSIEEAHTWAAKFAKACRCPQEVREFMLDEESTN